MRFATLLAALFLFFVLLANVQATTTIFDDYIYESNKSTASNGWEIWAHLWNDRASIDLPVGGVLVSEGECDFLDNLKICYEGKEFGYYSYDPHWEVQKLNIKVEAFLAEGGVAISFGAPNYQPNQDVEVTVTATNTGDIIAENASLKISLPPELQLSPISGKCKADGNWSGVLNINQELECVFSGKASVPGSIQAGAELEYFTGLENTTVSSSASATVNEFPLDMQFAAKYSNDSAYQVGDTVNYTLSLGPRQNISKLTINILFPAGSKYAASKEFDKYTDRLEYKASKLEQYLNLSINYTITRTGNSSVNHTASYISNDIGQSHLLTYDLSADHVPLAIRLNADQFSPDDQKATVFITNSDYIVYTGLKATAKLESGEETSTLLSDVSPVGHRDFRIPLSSELGTHSVTVTVEYQSEYGEQFSVSDTFQYSVSGEAEPQAPVESPEQQDSGEEKKKEVSNLITGLKSEEAKPIYVIGGLAILGFLLMSFFVLRRKRQAPLTFSPEEENLKQELRSLDPKEKPPSSGLQ